jgi:hypothetical protein
VKNYINLLCAKNFINSSAKNIEIALTNHLILDLLFKKSLNEVIKLLLRFNDEYNKFDLLLTYFYLSKYRVLDK